MRCHQIVSLVLKMCCCIEKARGAPQSVEFYKQRGMRQLACLSRTSVNATPNWLAMPSIKTGREQIVRIPSGNSKLERTVLGTKLALNYYKAKLLFLEDSFL